MSKQYRQTIHYQALSNQIFGDKHYKAGQFITEKEYAEDIPEAKKQNFKYWENSLRPFVEQMLIQIQELEAKLTALEKHISKGSPNK